ncbi:Putative ammonia monooxygenase [Serratia rubidaea]|uniref:Ammonia monooxygenase n=1 Tax=Serratia rubidaea TaxID=61652 RepID=A0A4V6JGD9_SERRU|nr:Putative ammonia monooxygenase [Serratia rubidaea]
MGLRFTRPILLLALRTLPQMLVSIAALMLFCGLLAWMLTCFLPVDMMTAYLATSPGGLDTVAIIAAGSRVDMSFVMALQTLRLFTILPDRAGDRAFYFQPRDAGLQLIVACAGCTGRRG